MVTIIIVIIIYNYINDNIKVHIAKLFPNSDTVVVGLIIISHQSLCCISTFNEISELPSLLNNYDNGAINDKTVDTATLRKWERA